MSKKTLLIIVSVIAACMYFIVSTIFMPAGGPPPLAITGTVTDAQSGQPIAEAKVFDDGYSEPDWEKIESGYYEPNLPHCGDVTDATGSYAPAFLIALSASLASIFFIWAAAPSKGPVR